MRPIDANALIKAVHNFFDGKVIDEPAYILRDVFCHIDNAPIVETYTKDDMTKEYLKGYNDCKEMTERPKGEWIANSFGEHYCSNCKFGAIDGEKDEILTDFCPNCGADMRQ